MARPVATDEQRAEQRNRIRRAAVEINNESGVSALSARAIAKRAGVSTGLLYSYFSNMSDLMRSIWIRPVAEYGREADAIALEYSDPIERIEALLVAYVAWAERHTEVYRGVLLFVRPATAPPVERDPLDDLPLPRALREAIVEGQATERIRSGDAAEMAQILWAGVHGAIALPINIDRYEVAPASQLAPAMITALMSTLTT